MLVNLDEMAKILGVSKSTFRANFLPLIDRENNKRSVKHKLFIKYERKTPSACGGDG